MFVCGGGEGWREREREGGWGGRRVFLELQTQDDLGSTPFLLAVSSGIQDTVVSLTELGAKVCAGEGGCRELENFILQGL